MSMWMRRSFAVFFVVMLIAIGVFWYRAVPMQLLIKSPEENLWMNIQLDTEMLESGKMPKELQQGLGLPTDTLPVYLRVAAHLRRGLCYGKLQKIDKMLADFDAAYRVDPIRTVWDGVAAEMGMVLWEQGDREGAQKLWQRIIDTDPTKSEPHEYVALTLSANPKQELRDEVLALMHATKALLKGPSRRAHCVMAIAFAANGKFEEAINAEQIALVIPWVPTQGEKLAPPLHAKEHIRERIELYKDNTPYRLKVPHD